MKLCNDRNVMNLDLLLECVQDWLVRVDSKSEIVKPDYDHAYLTKDNKLYILNWSNNELLKIYPATWGEIEGNLSDQVDLQAALNKKVDKIANAVDGNIPVLNADGSYRDSGTKVSDFAKKSELDNLSNNVVHSVQVNGADLPKDSNNAVNIDLTPYEEKVNKVTAISSNPSNTNYPSEKAVKDAIEEAIGSVEGGLAIPIQIELESELPDISTLNDGAQYYVQNMDVTAPDHTGKVWVNTVEGVKQFFKVIDQYQHMDGISIVQTPTGSWEVSSDWINEKIQSLMPTKLPNPQPLHIIINEEEGEIFDYDGTREVNAIIPENFPNPYSLNLTFTDNENLNVSFSYDGSESVTETIVLPSGGDTTKYRVIDGGVGIRAIVPSDIDDKDTYVVYGQATQSEEWTQTINVGDYLMFNQLSQPVESASSPDWFWQGDTFVVYEVDTSSSNTILKVYRDQTEIANSPSIYIMDRNFEIVQEYQEGELLIDVPMNQVDYLNNPFGVLPKIGDIFIYKDDAVINDSIVWINGKPSSGEVFNVIASHPGEGQHLVRRTFKTFGINPNNVFQLGTNNGGYDYTQNNNGIIEITNRDANELIKTNSYMLSGIGKNNTPDYSKDWYIQVYAYSNVYVKQVFYCKTTDEIYQRTCNNGTWSDFKLIGGEVVIYNSSVGIGQGVSFTPSQHLSRFGRLKILLLGQPSFGTYGDVNHANRNVRASVTDVTSANEQIVQVAVLTYLADLNDRTVVNARSSRQTRVASGTATNQQLNLVTVIGLP